MSPRQYAADIVKLKSRDERRAALERVPPIYRDMVRRHVENTLSVAWHWMRAINANPTLHVPDCVYDLFDAIGAYKSPK